MEDSAIIDLYFARNEAAITETNRKYGSYCRTVAQGVLADFQDVEECVSDTWLRAWNTIPPNRPGVLRQYLAKITRNLALDRFRTQTAEKRGSGQTEQVLEELQECIPGGRDPSSHAEMEELKTAINTFLQKMPSRNRGIFLRRYFYMEDFADIGHRYGIKEANVRLILSRMRKHLEAFLRKEGFIL
jgi:RNA polymerase sigma-70 factor (ECF subfamily)